MRIDTPSLKIMSWNVLASAAVKYHQGGKEELGSQRNKRHSKILKKIMNENCDIVLLQEVDRNFISRVRKTKKYKVVWKLPRIKLNPNAFGNAILYNNMLKKQGKAETLIWGHEQPTYDRKNALYVKFRWGSSHIDVVSLHLSGRKSKAREKLFDDTLSRLKSKYKIVGGDFNCDMGPRSTCVNVRDLETRHVAYTTCTFDYDPEKRPREIDKILVSPNLSIKHYKTHKTNCRGRSPYSRSGSDHFPLVVTLSEKKKSRKPVKKKSRKPVKRKSRKPARKKSRKPARKKSRKPVKKKSRKPVKKKSKSKFRLGPFHRGKTDDPKTLEILSIEPRSSPSIQEIVISSGVVSCDEFIKSGFGNNPDTSWEQKFAVFKYLLNLQWYDKPQGVKNQTLVDFTKEAVLGGRYTGSPQSIMYGRGSKRFHGMVPYQYTDKVDIEKYGYPKIFTNCSEWRSFNIGDKIEFNPIRYSNAGEPFAKTWDKNFPGTVVEILNPDENSSEFEIVKRSNENAPSNVTRYVVRSTNNDSDKGKYFVMRPNELNKQGEPNWCEIFHNMCYYYNLLKKYIVVAPEPETIEYKISTGFKSHPQPEEFITVTVLNPDYNRPVGSIRLSPKLRLIAPEEIVFTDGTRIRAGELIPKHFRHIEQTQSTQHGSTHYLTEGNSDDRRRISETAYDFASRLLDFWGVEHSDNVRRNEAGHPITDNEGRTLMHSGPCWGNKDKGYHYWAPHWDPYDDEVETKVEMVGPHNSTRDAVDFYFRPGLFSGQDDMFKKIGILHPLGI